MDTTLPGAPPVAPVLLVAPGIEADGGAGMPLLRAAVAAADNDSCFLAAETAPEGGSIEYCLPPPPITDDEDGDDDGTGVVTFLEDGEEFVKGEGVPRRSVDDPSLLLAINELLSKLPFSGVFFLLSDDGGENIILRSAMGCCMAFCGCGGKDSPEFGMANIPFHCSFEE